MSDNYKQKVKIAISILLMCISLVVKSQTIEIPAISADRPGVATPPFILDKNNLQIESGAAYERMMNGNILTENILYNTTLLRFGLNKNAEIRIQADYAQIKTAGQNITGFNPIIIGTKFLIAEEKGILPATAFLTNITLPYIGEKSFRPEHISPSFYLLMQNNITNALNICYNVGLEYDGSNAEPTEFAALCLGYNITQKLSIFAENYNYFANHTLPQSYIDLGGAYNIRRNLQLDLSGNISLQDVANYYMLNIGLSWRIPK